MNYIRCCKDCKERYPACHDKCERYIKEKEAYEKYKREITKRKMEDNSYMISEGDFLGDSGHLKRSKYIGMKHRKK